MYCQNCGNELRQSLVFCNRCGARAATELQKSHSVGLENKNADIIKSLSRSVGFVGVSGIIAICTLIYQLTQRGEVSFAIVVLVIVFSLLVFGIMFLIVNLISRFSASHIVSSFQPERQYQSLSDNINNDQLSSHFQSVPNSVTEYTTRNLESISKEKR